MIANMRSIEPYVPDTWTVVFVPHGKERKPEHWEIASRAFDSLYDATDTTRQRIQFEYRRSGSYVPMPSTLIEHLNITRHYR